MPDDFQTLGTKYNTSKFTAHSYAPVFEQFLGPLRDQPIHLLEIGICEGASLHVWLDYFPQAQIYGVDSNPFTNFTDSRLKTFCYPAQEPGVDLVLRPPDHPFDRDDHVVDRLQ